MSDSHDQVMPSGAWEFDEEVTHVFADMLERSIPQYDVMRSAVFEIACRFRKNRTNIIDLGSSRGDAIKPLLDLYGAQLTYMMVETSKPMLDAIRANFAPWIENQTVMLFDMDLREQFPPYDASVIQSILTLMFIPIERRQHLLQRIYDHLIPGGALILVEKVLGANALLDELMVDLYYCKKRANGYTDDQIERKRLSLQGVLVPVTAEWNVELLKMAGFTKIDCFWRWMNFAGWVAVK